jgi:hypothetical protein
VPAAGERFVAGVGREAEGLGLSAFGFSNGSCA